MPWKEKCASSMRKKKVTDAMSARSAIWIRTRYAITTENDWKSKNMPPYAAINYTGIRRSMNANTK